MSENHASLDFRGTTLSDRLLAGPLPAREALRYAVDIATALRQIHDRGAVHGALEPAAIRLAESHARLIAPDQFAGKSTDAPGDVYGFGAVVYEMLTGRKVGEECDPAVAPDGDGLLRLATKCLEKDPEQRYQNMQKVLMELKLLTLRRANRAEGEKKEHPLAAARADIAAAEERLVSRLAVYDAAIAALETSAAENRAQWHTAKETEAKLRTEVAALETRLAAQQARTAELEETVKRQARSMESMKMAMSQTDDLIERVVDAFHSLPESTGEQAEERLAAAMER